MVEEIIKGFFKIKRSDNKILIKLKGSFDNNNVHHIEQIVTINKSFNNRVLELDMSEVKTINMQAMAMIIITLKKLKESGISTTVTGLNRSNLNLAKKLGMQFITKIK